VPKKNGKRGLVTVTVEVSKLSVREGDALAEAIFGVAVAVARARRTYARVNAEFEAGVRMRKDPDTTMRKTPKWLK